MELTSKGYQKTNILQIRHICINTVKVIDYKSFSRIYYPACECVRGYILIWWCLSQHLLKIDGKYNQFRPREKSWKYT